MAEDEGLDLDWSEIAMTVGITLAVIAAAMAVAQRIPAVREWLGRLAATSSPSS